MSITNVFIVKDKVKVIETNMDIMYVMHKFTAMQSLNAIMNSLNIGIVIGPRINYIIIIFTENVMGIS